MTDRFEICDKVIPLSCDHLEAPDPVVVKVLVDTFLSAFLYTRVLARVRSNANRSVTIDMWDFVVLIVGLELSPTAVPRAVDRVRIDDAWWWTAVDAKDAIRCVRSGLSDSNVDMRVFNVSLSFRASSDVTLPHPVSHNSSSENRRYPHRQ